MLLGRKMLIPPQLIQLLLFRRIVFGESDQLSVSRASNSSLPSTTSTSSTSIADDMVRNSLSPVLTMKTELQFLRNLLPNSTAIQQRSATARQLEFPLIPPAIVVLIATAIDSLIIILVILEILLRYLLLALVNIIVLVIVIEIAIIIGKLLARPIGFTIPFVKLKIFRKLYKKHFERLARKLLKLQAKLTLIGLETPYLLPLKLLARFPKDWDDFTLHGWSLGQIDSAESKFFHLQNEIALLDRYMDNMIDGDERSGWATVRNLLRSLRPKKTKKTKITIPDDDESAVEPVPVPVHHQPQQTMTPARLHYDDRLSAVNQYTAADSRPHSDFYSGVPDELQVPDDFEHPFPSAMYD